MEYPEYYIEPVYQEQSEPAPLLDLGASYFAEMLKQRLTPAVCAITRDTVQNVVMAALDAGGIQLASPEIIVEAALSDPEITAEICELADKVLSQEIQ